MQSTVFFFLFTITTFHRRVAADGEVLPKYHCGIGTVTKVLSYASSTFCGRDKLNACCYAHDRCYDVNYQADEAILRGCDHSFSACIKRAYGSGFCSKFLGFTHATAVEQFGAFYRTVFGYDPVIELSQQEWSAESMRAHMPAVRTLDFDANEPPASAVEANGVIRARRVQNGVLQTKIGDPVRDASFELEGSGFGAPSSERAANGTSTN
ncbi:hypothetical protein M3Y99_00688400 [Aphelenchoides fujianensis]|nr:hypothetical protein M3Y99_00688400 [Aphelenchoides fujianensis]